MYPGILPLEIVCSINEYRTACLFRILNQDIALRVKCCRVDDVKGNLRGDIGLFILCKYITRTLCTKVL